MLGQHILLLLSVSVMSTFAEFRPYNNLDPQYYINQRSRMVGQTCLLNEKLKSNSSLNIFDTLSVTMDLPESVNKDEVFAVRVIIKNLKNACFPIQIEVLYDYRIMLDIFSRNSYKKCSCGGASDGFNSMEQIFKMKATDYGSFTGLRISVKVTSIVDSSLCTGPITQYLRPNRYIELAKNVMVERAFSLSGSYVMSAQFFRDSPIFVNETNDEKIPRVYLQIGKSQVMNRVWRIEDTNLTSYGYTLHTIKNEATGQYLYVDETTHDENRRFALAKRTNKLDNKCWNLWAMIPQNDGSFFIYNHLRDEYLYTADKIYDGDKCLVFTWKGSNLGNAWDGVENNKRKWFLTDSKQF